MSVSLNKSKSIGKVLFVVEGGWTEPYILRRIFTTIFDYQFETVLRDKKYSKYNSKENATSQVFVINAEESNIKNIDKDNQFLNRLFAELIENYDFDVDNAAIYYLFDRDSKSNTDVAFIKDMLSVLVNARDNEGYERQGMLLMSYPSIESFTVSNFEENSFNKSFDTGHNVKIYAHSQNFNNQKLSEDTLLHATSELLNALKVIEQKNFDIESFGDTSRKVFEYEERTYQKTSQYRLLSLVVIALIDLGLVEVEEQTEEESCNDKGLLDILAEAEEDVRTGRVAPVEDMFANIRTMLQEKCDRK